MSSTVAKMEKSTLPWWLVLIEGVALLILGFYFLTAPAMTALVATKVIGIYWLIAGIFRIIGMFMDTSMWGLKLFSGLLGIAAGIIVLEHPLVGPLVLGGTLILLLGIQGIIMGVIGIIAAFKGAGWGAAIMGVISILFGILILNNILAFALTLPFALGLLAIFGGISAIVVAFRLR